MDGVLPYLRTPKSQRIRVQSFQLLPSKANHLVDMCDVTRRLIFDPLTPSEIAIKLVNVIFEYCLRTCMFYQHPSSLHACKQISSHDSQLEVQSRFCALMYLLSMMSFDITRGLIVENQASSHVTYVNGWLTPLSPALYLVKVQMSGLGGRGDR
jgi:hypothetical protein